MIEKINKNQGTIYKNDIQSDLIIIEQSTIKNYTEKNIN